MWNAHIMYKVTKIHRKEINKISDIIFLPQVFAVSVPYEVLYTELQNEAHSMLRETHFLADI
jgi:hypothetical protein